MSESTQDTQFPTDWNEFETQYNRWRGAIDVAHSVVRLRNSAAKFPGRNMLADEVMGIYKTDAGVVELSAVTFPGFGAEDRGKTFRYIGITWLVDGKNVNGGLVDTFAELESALIAGAPSDER